MCKVCGGSCPLPRPGAGRPPELCSDDCRRQQARRAGKAYRIARLPQQREAMCPTCGSVFTTRDARKRYCKRSCRNETARRLTPEGDARRAAKNRQQNHRRRAARANTDLTASMIAAMFTRARHCPMCNVRLSVKLNTSRSKNLDHIVPIVEGGTHTVGNVRVICRTCNLKRPKDGSDFTGTESLWARRG